MVSGEWDDILTPANAQLLLARLSEPSKESHPPRDLQILPTLVHNYEPFSTRVIAAIGGWLQNRFGAPLVASPAASIRIWAWVLGFAGTLGMLTGCNRWLRLAQQASPGSEPPALTLNHPRRFLVAKLLYWLAALPVAALLGSLFFFLPLEKPVFNLIYVGFIGGYGLLLAVVYGRGKMPGVRGRLWDPAARAARFKAGADGMKWEWRRLLAVAAITVGLLVLTAAYARTGWYYVFPLNTRLLWLAIFAPFTALGFWIGLQEGRIQPAPRGLQTALALIGLFPFFLYVLLMAAIGSLSGMIGGIQGLLILWLVLAFGNLIQAAGQRAWLTAICMAILLYWLVLPQGVLF
jgi:hypothetical protein